MTDSPAPRFLRRKEAANYIRETRGIPCSFTWLAKLACVGGGPAYRKVGRVPIYEPSALDEWAEARISKLYRSTSEYAAAA